MAGEFIDAPAPSSAKGEFIDTPPPKPDKNPLSNVIDLAKKGSREASRLWAAGQYNVTEAARHPVETLGTALGTPFRGIAGAAASGMTLPSKNAAQAVQNMPIGAIRGMVDPKFGQQSYDKLSDVMFGKQNPKAGPLQKVGRATEDFVFSSAMDPVMQAGPAFGKVIKGAADIPVSALRGKAPDVLEAMRPGGKLEGAAKFGKSAASAIGTVSRPLVNAYVDALFATPLGSIYHGVGNIGTMNWASHGLGTAAQGLRYGLTGIPKGTAEQLERTGAAHSFPVPEAQKFGPTGLLTKIPGVGKAVEAMRHGSQDFMNRLEMGQRAAAFEYLLKTQKLETPEQLAAAKQAAQEFTEKAKPKPKLSADQQAMFLASNEAKRARQSDPRWFVDKQTGEMHPGRSLETRPSGRGAGYFSNPPVRPEKVSAAEQQAAKRVNARLGSYNETSPLAKASSELGGAFGHFAFVGVPRSIGGALLDNPAHIEQMFKATDATNKDIIGKNAPYHITPGGAVADEAQLLFNPFGYALTKSRIGPILAAGKDKLTSPDTFNLGEQLKANLAPLTPGAELGLTLAGKPLFPSKAPLGAQLGTETGLFRIASPAQKKEAILRIMRDTGLDAYQAEKMLQRMRRR